MHWHVLDVLPVVGTVAGVVVGAFAAELRTVLQGARERRAVLSRLLFQLLDLRFEIRRRDPEVFSRLMAEFVARRFGPEAGRAAESPEVQALWSQAHAIAREAFPLDRLHREFGKAVQDIAAVSPLLAYTLSGREHLLDVKTPIDTYIAELTKIPSVVVSEGDRQGAERARVELLRVAQKEALDTLAEDIRAVAGHISPWMSFRVRRVLKRQDKVFTAAANEFLNDLFERMSVTE